jgi:hypothetical protein
MQIKRTSGSGELVVELVGEERLHEVAEVALQHLRNHERVLDLGQIDGVALVRIALDLIDSGNLATTK